MLKAMTIEELIDELTYMSEDGRLNKDAICELWTWSLGSDWPTERLLSADHFLANTEANKLIIRVKCWETTL